MSYIFRNINREDYRLLRKSFIDCYVLTKKDFGERVSYKTLMRLRKSHASRLSVDDCTYRFRYSGKRKAIGIFLKKDGIERLVTNEITLNSEEQKIVMSLYSYFNFSVQLWKDIKKWPVEEWTEPVKKEKSTVRRFVENIFGTIRGYLSY